MWLKATIVFLTTENDDPKYIYIGLYFWCAPEEPISKIRVQSPVFSYKDDITKYRILGLFFFLSAAVFLAYCFMTDK